MRINVVCLGIFFFYALSLQAAEFKVGLVLDKDGKKDKGFNSSAVEGLQRAKKTFKFEIEALEADGDRGHEPLLREFAKRGFNLVFALGEARAEAVKKVAAEFPRTQFAIVDGQVDAPNVRSILFKEQEGAYLVGALSALMTKSNKLGFIGGMNIPVIQRFYKGFEAGIRKMNSGISLSADYIGTTGEAWHNSSAAKKIAIAQYDKGIDIVFAVAGGSNMGVFDAAAEKKKYAVGVSNQNGIKPGRVLTSMRKRVDIVLFMTCQDAFLGGFTGEIKHYGLTDQAVDYVIDSHNEKLIPVPVLKKIKKLELDILEGRTLLPET